MCLRIPIFKIVKSKFPHTHTPLMHTGSINRLQLNSQLRLTVVSRGAKKKQAYATNQ